MPAQFAFSLQLPKQIAYPPQSQSQTARDLRFACARIVADEAKDLSPSLIIVDIARQ